MTGYVLVKNSRTYTSGLGYRGRSWEVAGLYPPPWPLSLELAEAAAVALTAVNAVGFSVVEYVEYQEDAVRSFP